MKIRIYLKRKFMTKSARFWRRLRNFVLTITEISGPLLLLAMCTIDWDHFDLVAIISYAVAIVGAVTLFVWAFPQLCPGPVERRYSRMIQEELAKWRKESAR